VRPGWALVLLGVAYTAVQACRMLFVIWHVRLTSQIATSGPALLQQLGAFSLWPG